MKKKFIISLVCVLLNTSFLVSGNKPFAGNSSAGDFVSKTDSSICIQIGKNFLSVDFISPEIFRIRMNNENTFPEGWLVRYGIVSTKFPGHKVKSSVKGNIVEIFTDKISLSIDKRDGKITLKDSKGNILTQNDQSPQSDKERGFNLSFKLQDGERLYGFGDVSRKEIQRRGQKGEIFVKNVNSYIPISFVMSDHGWGLFINTTNRHSFDAGATVKDRLTLTSPQGNADYYIMAGNSMIDVLGRYTDITGKAHLLPKWGYGLTWVCDERGVRARDVLYEAYEFRRQGIPCDIIGLEPDWMEKHYDFSTKKQWSKERFDIPFWLKGDDYGTFPVALKNMGFKLSLWLCTDYDFSQYEEYKLQLNKKSGKNILNPDHSKGNVKKDAYSTDIIIDTLLDDTKRSQNKNITDTAKTIEPWFDHLKKFVDDGASMFKLDASNQAHLRITPGQVWKNGMVDYEMVNLYPLLYNKQMSLGYKEYTGKRAMIFSAAGYSGIQRFSATWSGDTGGGAGPLVSLLNHGLSGHSNVCTDMQIHTEAGIHFGFFQTLSQILGWQMYVEPWFLGDKKLSMVREYANLRYKLIPYIYTMAHIASEKAVPVMRALSLMYPDDRNCDRYLHQFMFGDAFLVSAFDTVVYLPEGEWIDYWTGKKFKGNQEIKAEFPENKGGPLFVKAGAIIPTQVPKSSIGTETPENIIWEIFPEGDTKFTLYEDDGDSYKYLEGKIAKTVISCRESGDNIAITISPRNGSYDNMPAKRTHSVKIYYPRKLTLQNAEYPVTWDEKTNMLSIDSIPEGKSEIRLSFR